MKLTKITAAAIALAFAGVFGTSAHAQNLTYNTGDLLIGFEQSGSANNYVVDLGAANQFIDATGPLTFSLSTADLTSAFGSSWASNSQTNLVQWGVIGGTSRTTSLTLGGDTLAKNTLFYTQGELTPGTPSDAPLALNNAGQNVINGKITSFTTDFKGETPSTGSTGLLQATIESKATSNSYGDETNNQSVFGIGFSIEQPASGSFTGPTNSVLDLYQLNATSSGTAPGTLLGGFSLGSNGVLTFNAAPEPSTYALMGLGVMFLVWQLRRKTVSSL